MTRRHFSAMATSFAFFGFAKQQAFAQSSNTKLAVGYGDLVPDPNGLLDLPKGFSYEVISELGNEMSDGHKVPDAADGMGCIPISDTHVSLVRNHELRALQTDAGPFAANTPDTVNAYDFAADGTPLPGGTTTLFYNLETRKVDREFLSLVGTIRNCAGGITPWGSWLTCEENVSRSTDRPPFYNWRGDEVPGVIVQKDHGWIFEVPANYNGLTAPVPLKEMGRFNHEAAAVDPRTGIVYLTEDRDDSLLYRFIPNTYGKLQDGGRLQALAVTGSRALRDSRNWNTPSWRAGEWHEATWVDLDNPESPNDDLRQQGRDKGAVIFARGEGIHWGYGEVYFCCTSGGTAKLGQIMRYRPSLDTSKDSAGSIQLFVESNDPSQFNYADNLTVAPNGHLFVCEDQYTDTVNNHLRGVTPDGRLYDFARVQAQTEPAGACFSPSGSTLFVNLYSPTKTLAITGPWHTVSDYYR